MRSAFLTAPEYNTLTQKIEKGIILNARIFDDVDRKIVLCLLDCVFKSANEIANEIDEPLATVDNQLTALVSENICEEVNQDEISQYVIIKDIETFTQLVKEFLSDKEECKKHIEQFITSKCYLNRIDDELVDYILGRFYLDLLYQTDEEKESTRRILLVSPSALLFALHGETGHFHESWTHRNQLSPLQIPQMNMPLPFSILKVDVFSGE